jgi:sugar-specific transcriptional regulator TrmB
MDIRKIQKILEKLGLSEKEAKAYLALLALGEATAARLASRTGITRTLLYEIMDKLIERGLVSSVIKEGIKHFRAAEPGVLLNDLEEKKKNLKQVMPELSSLAAAEKKETAVSLYRGRKGVNTVLRMIIEEKADYYLTGGAQEACDFFEHENKVFVKRAAEAGIKGFILASEGDGFFIGKLEEYRYIPAQLLSMVTNIIWGDKTAILVWSDPCHAIVIENDKIAESNISTFEYLWKGAKKPTKADVKKRLFE